MADASLGTAVLHTKLDTSQLRIGLSTAEKDTRSAVQRISADLAGIGKNLQGIGTRLSIGLTAPLTAIGVAGIKSAMQLETFSASLNVLIGDTGRAQAAFEDLYEFSANAPFSWEALTAGARVLAAFGTQAENLVPTLSMLGDIAAGTQTDLAGLAEIYGRVQITGRVAMEEVNSLAAKGIPIYTELARVMGVSETQVRELVSSGKVGFPQLEAAFKGMTSEGGKFFGMMDAQADTVAGRVNRLKDSFSQVADVVGTALIPAFDRLVGAAQRATDWFVNLDESTQGLLVGLGVTLAVTGPVLLGVGTLLVQLPKLVTAFNLLRAATLPFIGPAGLFIAAAIGLGYLVNRFTDAEAPLRAHQDVIEELTAKYQEYRKEINVTTDAEREGAIARLQTIRSEMLERVRLLRELADEQKQSVQGFLNSPIGKFLMPGFLNVEASAGYGTMAEIDKLEGSIRSLGSDIRALQTGSSTLVTRPAPGVTPPPVVPPPGVTPQVRGVAARTWDDVLAELDKAGTEAMRRAAFEGTDEAYREAAAQRVRLIDNAITEGLTTFYGQTPEGDLQALAERRARALSETLEETVTTALGAFGRAAAAGVGRDVELLLQRVANDAVTLSPEQAAALARAPIVRARMMMERGTASLDGLNLALLDGANVIGPKATAAVQDAIRSPVDALTVDLTAAGGVLAEFAGHAGAFGAAVRAAADQAKFAEGLGVFSDRQRGVFGRGSAFAVRPATAEVGEAYDELFAAVDAFRAGNGSVEAVRVALDALTTLVPMSVTNINRLTDGILKLDRAAQDAARAAEQNERAPMWVPPGGLPSVQLPTSAYQGFRPRETGDIDKAFIKASEDAGNNITTSATSFADIVVAGAQSVKGLFTSILQGDAQGAIKSGFDLFGDIGAALLPGFGPLIKIGTGLMGDLFSALSGGGSRDAEERRRREQQQARSVPAMTISFTVNQQNTYHGAPRDPANEQAFGRQADQLFEAIYRRHLGPRLDAIERRLGMAGA